MYNFFKFVSCKKFFILFSLFAVLSTNLFSQYAKTSTKENIPNIVEIYKNEEKVTDFDEYILGPGDEIYIEFLNIQELWIF